MTKEAEEAEAEAEEEDHKKKPWKDHGFFRLFTCASLLSGYHCP